MRSFFSLSSRMNRSPFYRWKFGGGRGILPLGVHDVVAFAQLAVHDQVRHVATQQARGHHQPGNKCNAPHFFEAFVSNYYVHFQSQDVSYAELTLPRNHHHHRSVGGLATLRRSRDDNDAGQYRGASALTPGEGTVVYARYAFALKRPSMFDSFGFRVHHNAKCSAANATSSASQLQPLLITAAPNAADSGASPSSLLDTSGESRAAAANAVHNGPCSSSSGDDESGFQSGASPVATLAPLPTRQFPMLVTTTGRGRHHSRPTPVIGYSSSSSTSSSSSSTSSAAAEALAAVEKLGLTRESTV